MQMRKKCFSMMRRWGRGSETSYGKSGIVTLQTLKYLCQSFTVSLFTCFLIFGPFYGTPICWCWWWRGWNQPRSELKKIVASWRSHYSLLKHYSSPVSLTCHFPQCVFAAKPHHGGQYLLHIWHKIKVHEPFYKLRIFFAGLYFGSFTLPANKQTLGSYSFWPWRSPIECSSCL